MAGKKGNTYASKNRKIRQEALREQLAAQQYITRLNKMLDEDWIQPVLDEEGQPVVAATGPVVVNRVAEIKGKADVMLRMLNKVLPDLKAVEIEGEVTHHHDITDEPMTEDEWEKQYSDGAPADMTVN